MSELDKKRKWSEVEGSTSSSTNTNSNTNSNSSSIGNSSSVVVTGAIDEGEIDRLLSEERDNNRAISLQEPFPRLIDRYDLHYLASRIVNEPPKKRNNPRLTENSAADHHRRVIHDVENPIDEFGGHVFLFELDDDEPSECTRAIQEEEILKTRLTHHTKNGVIEMDSFWDAWKRSDGLLKLRILASSDPHEDKWRLAREFRYKMATTFMPGYARALYEHFGGGRVLDPCAGWGDRFMGALCADPAIVKQYVAFDPNLCLRAGYADIAKLRGQRVVRMDEKCLQFSNGFEINSLPFEKGARQLLNDNSFDFAFTSPPFFEYEIYNRETNPEYHDWIMEFYVPLFQETCRVLKPGSFFGIHIGDTSAGKISDFLESKVNLISDFEYRYKIGLRGLKSDKIRTIYMYQKVPEKSFRRENVYHITNPPVRIERVIIPEKNIFVINDGLCCIGGSKQRLIGRLMYSVPFPELVYAGPEEGLAQVALALAGSLWKRKATVFLNTYKDASEKGILTRLAINLGANIQFSDNPKGRTLKDTQDAATKYVNSAPEARYLVPFGLKSDPGTLLFESFKEALTEAIRLGGAEERSRGSKRSSSKDLMKNPPKRLWIVAGSSFLVNVLHSIWPSTHFLIVQVGKTVYPDMVAHISHKLYVAPERFADLAKAQPPYKTVPWYDAKLWQFVLQDAQDGDFIWNVGRKPDEEEILSYSLGF